MKIFPTPVIFDQLKSRILAFMLKFRFQETHKYFKFFDKPGYYNLLTDAWETKYSDCRAAAIDRLERLCQEKIHLKVPLNNQNLKSKTKSQIVDVSVLKAPTGNAPDRPQATEDISTDQKTENWSVLPIGKTSGSEPNNEDDKMSTGGDTPDKSRPPTPERPTSQVDNLNQASEGNGNSVSQSGHPFIDDNHPELIQFNCPCIPDKDQL